MTVTITEENFRREVLRESKPVLLEFYGVWCSKCAMMEDVLTEFAEDHDGEIKVCRADIDKNEQLAVRFGVDTVPAFVSRWEGCGSSGRDCTEKGTGRAVLDGISGNKAGIQTQIIKENEEKIKKM